MKVVVSARRNGNGSVSMVELRDRYLSGGEVTAEELFAAAGLTAGECLVVRERLAGRSLTEIAVDAGCSRQAIHTREHRACRKLGLRRSLDEIILAAERSGRGASMAERGRQTVPEGMNTKSGWRPQARWERRHEVRVRRFLANAGS